MIGHRETPRLMAHFDRMRSQLAGVLPSFLAIHQPGEAADSKAEILIREEQIALGLPERYREMKARRRLVNQNYVDVVAFAALSSPIVAGFDFVWLMEYDVDYTGDWAGMFMPHMDRDADLLATRILRPEEHTAWLHWSTLTYPPEYADGDRLSAFIPLFRISRRLIDTYRQEMQKPGWFGHFEALLPTIATHHRYKIEDFSQAEPYVSATRKPLDFQTFGAAPVRSTSYYHESPQSFAKLDMLYHPVKPDS